MTRDRTGPQVKMRVAHLYATWEVSHFNGEQLRNIIRQLCGRCHGR